MISLGIDPQEMQSQVSDHAVSKIQIRVKRPPTDKQIERRNCIMGKSVVIRRVFMVSEMTQAQKDKHYMTSLICCDLYAIYYEIKLGDQIQK